MTRADKLKALHAQSPDEKVYQVKVPRKFWRYLTTHEKVYLTVDENKIGGVHWSVLVTNRKWGQDRSWGTRAYGADFRVDNGELYRRNGLSGAWKSAIWLGDVTEENEVVGIFRYVGRIVDLAYEQHLC